MQKEGQEIIAQLLSPVYFVGVPEDFFILR